LCVLLASLAFCGSIVWTLNLRTAGAAIVMTMAVLAVAALVGVVPLREESAPPQIGLVLASELASAWLLGGATTAMLLGHWYLTAPMMSLAPLVRLNRLFGAAAAVRGLLAGASLLQVAGTSLGETHAIWLSLRWAAGIIGPLILCVLVGRTLRYRNTQSATGILFAGVILTFIGETAAMLLARDLNWPL
jgi:hypothetical protein